MVLKINHVEAYTNFLLTTLSTMGFIVLYNLKYSKKNTEKEVMQWFEHFKTVN